MRNEEEDIQNNALGKWEGSISSNEERVLFIIVYLFVHSCSLKLLSFYHMLYPVKVLEIQ